MPSISQALALIREQLSLRSQISRDLPLDAMAISADPRNSHLCGDCQRLVPATEPRWNNYPDVRRAKFIDRTAMQGCQLCLIIIDKAKDLGRDTGFARRKMGLVHGTDGNFYLNLGSRSVPTNGSPHLQLLEGLELDLSRNSAWIKANLNVETDQAEVNKVSPDMGDDNTFSHLKSWLDTCRDSHTKCSESNMPNYSPDRVIDLGVNEHGISPKLRNLNEIPPKSKYATLSHCWGPGAKIPGFLNVDNEQQFKREILFDTLPLKFQQAMWCAKKLGLRYIWIDCLCIIQDSHADWEKQASQMANIFEHAHFTIAANNSSDYRGPLFKTRSPKIFKRCHIHLPWKDKAYTVSPRNAWESEVESGPLFERAWVFQELMLSRRILFFGERCIFWGCRDGVACEMYPGQQLVPKNKRNLALFPPPGSWPHWFESTPEAWLWPDLTSASARHLSWMSLVQRYTRGLLTYEAKDKLIALSGIARRVGTCDDYLAGIWKHDLPTSLLWHTKSPPGREIPGTHVPSWSWASISGFVYALRDDFYKPGEYLLDYRAEVLATSVTPMGLDPFGQVVHGSIELRGYMTLSPNESYDSSSPSFNGDQILVSLDCDPPSHHDGLWGKEIFFCLILPRCGLVLRSTGLKGEYRRMGVFSSKDWYGASPIGKGFYMAALAYSQTCPEESILRKDSDDGQVVIRIV